MDESLTEQRRVSEGFSDRKTLLLEKNRTLVTERPLTVSNQKATANYVPAAAVIRRWQRCQLYWAQQSAGGFLKSDVSPAQPGRVIGNWET